MSHSTQRSRILDLLIDARGGWVPAPELARLGGLQFQTRIYEIRHRLGLKVENRKEHHGGQTHSWYRLISGPAPTVPAKRFPAAPQPEPAPGPAPLFADLAPERHRDDG